MTDVRDVEIEFDDMLENEHYLFLPSPTGEQDYMLQILVGQFKDTKIQFFDIRLDGKKGELSFDFDVLYSPIEGLSPINNPELRKTASLMVQDVLNNAIKNKTVELYDPEKGEKIEY